MTADFASTPYLTRKVSKLSKFMLEGQRFGLFPSLAGRRRRPNFGLVPVPVGLLPIIASRCGSLAAGVGLRLPLAEIGAKRLFQAMATGFGHACGLRVISLPIGHGQVYTVGTLGGEM
jgi:hypothetical protein